MSPYPPISQPEPEECAQSVDPTALWTSTQVAALMARQGVPARHQATEIAQICAISISQARRKLRGAAWLFQEVLALCRHYGAHLDEVFPPEQGLSTLAQDASQTASASSCPATLLIEGQRVTCTIQPGAMLPTAQSVIGTGSGAPLLLAAHQPEEGWIVATPQSMANEGVPGPHYAVHQLQIHTPAAQARARIAVLDDDIGAAEALSDWFNEVGYLAQSFTSADQLMATSLQAHDAYVIDLILGGGRTSQSLVEQIRRAQPRAPIVLLTGQLRDGTASEATLTTILRTQGVTFFEKPVRPAVLTAAIQSGLDRLASATHA